MLPLCSHWDALPLGCIKQGSPAQPFLHFLTWRRVCLQVVRCTLENSVSVAKTFLLADVVVTEVPEKAPAVPAGVGAGDYDY